ncbi:MAG: hypothetical protein U1F42_10375 [Candidatus Competibacteraceae bacterium]
MKKHIVAALSVLGLLVTTGCATMQDKEKAAADKSATQQAAQPTLAVRATETATATVKAIDLQNRKVTLKGQGGKVFTIKVSDEVRNLPQVKVGDRVVVTYEEALSVQITGKAGTGISKRVDAVSASRAEPGQLPAGAVRETTKITANIIAVDKLTRHVTIKGAKQTVTLKVPEDIDINTLKVGDEILAEYVEELAIKVEPAAPVKKKSAPLGTHKSK